MLFEPDRHEALCDTTWDASCVRDAIREIGLDIEQRHTAEAHWPVHPLDDDGGTPRSGFKSLYLGRAGVWWALWYLQRQGALALGSDPVRGLQEADAAYHADPDTGTVVPSYYLGEVGILLLLWRVTGSRAVEDRLHAAIESNITNTTNEALWAAPGTMLGAWHLWEATRHERWRELFLRNVEQLWQTWHFDDQVHCHLWTQDMYGKRVQYLGAGHGFAGNVYPLLKGASLLDAERRETLYERCAHTLSALARHEGTAVNWPPGTYTPRPDGPAMLMQWCHGAPGVVTALTDFPRDHSPDVDTLLTGAGEAIWQAGPLTKGAGLCHGTAGNGYAFLSLYQRSGDPLWLARARSFAMHAISQVDRMRAQYGQGRYSLWTGDAGVAIYLWHCIEGRGGMPGLDVIHPVPGQQPGT